MTPSTANGLWPRVRELGDTTRNLLATANTGGIALLLALSASLAGDGVSPGWTVPAVGFFALGVICVVVGYLLAEHRVIAQAKANDDETAANKPPTFPVWKWGITWNLASLACLLVGAVIGIRGLNAVQVANPQAPPAEQAGVSQPNPSRYAAIVDAGSNGSRLWIFKWSTEARRDPTVEKLVVLEDKIAASKDCRLTYMTGDEKGTCDCLIDLLKQGEQHIAKAAGSASAAATIPLWVKATGGVRKQPVLTQIDILEKTNRCLQPEPVPSYSWRGAEAIGGSTEALYAWLAVNYARKTLQSHTGTFGIVEIGGESAQVAFKVPMAIAPAQRGSVLGVPLSSGTLHVYALSDVLGKDAVVGTPPDPDIARECALDGDVTDCRTAIDKFLCPPAGKPCSERSPEFQPPRDTKFVGLSNFKHVVLNSGLRQGSLADVENRADMMCGKGAKKEALREEFIPATLPSKFRKSVCLDALYTTRVAELAWKLSLTDVAPADADLDPDWPLGAMFLELAQRSSTNPL